jgi:hypothetical protein
VLILCSYLRLIDVEVILPLSLKPAAGARDGYRLVHHPLAHPQVLVDPHIDVFVFGDRVFLETGSMVPGMGLVSQNGPTKPIGISDSRSDSAAREEP